VSFFYIPFYLDGGEVVVGNRGRGRREEEEEEGVFKI
jgi:hypothetical protein